MECIIKNISINYEIIGEGKPIIMIHGYYPDHRLMTGCMEPIFSIKDGYKRIYIDLPGMGKSKSAEWINNCDIMLNIVIDFIEKIIPTQNFLLVGESYGGYLSRGLIYKMPDRILDVEIANSSFLQNLMQNGYGFSFNVDCVSKRFDRPALILLGKQDDCVGYKDAWDILENFPRATFSIIDKAGHNLQIEQEELFNSLITEWLVRCD